MDAGLTDLCASGSYVPEDAISLPLPLTHRRRHGHALARGWGHAALDRPVLEGVARGHPNRIDLPADGCAPRAHIADELAVRGKFAIPDGRIPESPFRSQTGTVTQPNPK